MSYKTSSVRLWSGNLCCYHPNSLLYVDLANWIQQDKQMFHKLYGCA